jgi:hypothetical protein
MDEFHAVAGAKGDNMRKFTGILILILSMTTAVLAEGRGEGKDDHDDKAPVQAGYAVVTPSAGATSLVAFETFGLRDHGNNNSAAQAGLLPPGLTTSSMLFVDSSGRLSKNLGVAVVNPNSASITLAMTLRKSDGTQLATTNLTVESKKQVSKFVTELFATRSDVPSDFVGTLTVTSSGSSPLPFSIVGLRFRGQNFSTIEVTNLAPVTTALPSLATGVGGAGAILLPQFAAGGGWATEIVLVNTGSAGVTARVDLFKTDGTALSTALNGVTASSFTNIAVPAGGVVILAPRNEDGDDDF